MFKRVVAILAAVTIAALASESRADTVTFTVLSGQFTGGAAGTNVSKTFTGSSGAQATVSFAANTAIQSFSSVSDNQVLNISDFGLFSVSGSGTSNINIPSGQNFTLTIQLIDPSAANGGTTATLTGSLQNNHDEKNLTITFPTPLTLPSSGLPDVVFNFATVVLSEVPTESSANLTGTATYHAAPVPLPGVAATGLSLLGVTALARLRKRPAMA